MEQQPVLSISIYSKTIWSYMLSFKISTRRKYFKNCLLSIFSQFTRERSSLVGACRAYQEGAGCITVRWDRGTGSQNHLLSQSNQVHLHPAVSVDVLLTSDDDLRYRMGLQTRQGSRNIPQVTMDLVSTLPGTPPRLAGLASPWQR